MSKKVLTYNNFNTYAVAVLTFVILFSLVLSGCSQSKLQHTAKNPAPVEPHRFPIVTAKKIGFIDEKGSLVIKPQYDDSSDSFNEGLCWVKSGDRYGYIDVSGKYVINPQFADAFDFHEGLALVMVKDKYGFVNKSGKLAINPQFVNAGSFSDGLAMVQLGDKFGYINKTGTNVIRPDYDFAGDFSDGLAQVTFGGRDGFINTKGQYVINPQFYGADKFSEGLAIVQESESSDKGYIDKTGKFVINPQFANASYFSEGMACICIGDKWGYIDNKGKIIINPTFDDAFPFAEKLARVQSGGKWGYIDKKGVYVVNPQYDEAFDFTNGLASAVINNTASNTVTLHYLNSTGKSVWSLEMKNDDFIDVSKEAIATVSSSQADASSCTADQALLLVQAEYPGLTVEYYEDFNVYGDDDTYYCFWVTATENSEPGVVYVSESTRIIYFDTGDEAFAPDPANFVPVDEAD